MNPFIKPTTNRRPQLSRLAAVGIAAAGLTVVCAGVATAVVPFSPVAPSPTPVVQSADTDWSAMPQGYTRAQYEAFWNAGYSAEDVATLNDLWKSDSIRTKARAGQMILDGDVLPVAPSPATAEPAADLSTPKDGDQAKYEAFWDAGYTDANLAKLNDLWKTGSFDTKARAGKMILEGKTPPVAPSGTSRHHRKS